MHKVVTATTDAITNGYVAPSLQHDGLRWRATWCVIQNEQIDSQVNTLYSSTPNVLGIKELDDMRCLYEEFTDASCRRSLRHANWKPELPRTRNTSTRSLRSTCVALADPFGYFVTETIQDDNSLLELSSQLRNTRCKKETGLDLACQARLEPRTTDEYWDLTFEIFHKKIPAEIIRWSELLSASK